MRKNIAARLIAASLSLGLLQAPVSAGSSINTGQPETDTSLNSLVVRQLALAAASDINAILGMHAATSAGQCPSSPVAGEDCLLVGSTPYTWTKWTGSVWATIGTIDPVSGAFSPSLVVGTIVANAPLTASFSGGVATVGFNFNGNFAVSGGSLTLNPIAAGDLIANCTSGVAEPTLSTFTSCLDRNIGSTSGVFPLRGGSVWGAGTFGTGLAVSGAALNLQPASVGAIGGVNSIAGVSHNWVSSIDTAGLPHLTQPAFGDISGTLAASQLPLPTASTLGGIESYASVAHQWINTISTSGVPSSSQPAIADISGWGTGVAAALGVNVGSAGAPVLFNAALGTPSSGTLGSGVTLGGVTMTLGSDANGDIYCRSGGVLTRIGAGASAALLTSGGAGVCPTWAAAPGGGNVSNSGTPTINQIAQWINATQVAGVNLASLVAQGAGITITGTTSLTIAQSLANQMVQVQPTNAANVGAAVMMGYGVAGAGGGCRITPAYSSRVEVTIIGSAQNSLSAAIDTITARWGTLPAPTYATGSSGTSVGPSVPAATSGTVLNLPFSVGGVVTGLTPGTTYWFDLFVSPSSGNATIQSVGCTLKEL